MLFDSGGFCPVCHTKGKFWCDAFDWEYRTSTDAYTYLQCPDCGTLFIEKIDKPDLHSIYPSNYYSFAEKSGGPLFRLKNYFDRRLFKKILSKIPAPTISILDIGGGTGEVLDVLKTADKRIIYTEIVDIDEKSAAIAEENGHVYRCTSVEDYQADRKFELILLLNIIEHVSEPASLINKAASMLAEGGMVVIKTPNANSLDARMFRKSYWGGLHCPRHWIIFNDHSARRLLKRGPLKIEQIRFTQGAPFWAYSILLKFGDKDITRKKTPLVEHPLFPVLAAVFALFDYCRRPFSKTSQMFLTLKKS